MIAFKDLGLPRPVQHDLHHQPVVGHTTRHVTDCYGIREGVTAPQACANVRVLPVRPI